MWEQIRSNQRKAVFVVGLMGVLLGVTGVALGYLIAGGDRGILIGAVIGFGVWLFLWILSVSQGDQVLLSIARAREVEHKDHPRLFNIVEEMTIAASLPKRPRVFIVDDPAPNAFATGRKPDNAGVTVTTGLLRVLNRDELQGVVAHEIGHIKNRDVALMTTAGVMLGAIVLLAEVGLRLMWYSGGGRRRSRSKDEGGAQVVILIVSLLFVILAPFLAQLLYFALSRKREYLADASGALYTRYPEGLASALEKIGGIAKPQADQSRVTAPMYIVRPLKQGQKRSLRSAFATHPPIEERVRILRSMGGNADYRAYEQAYASQHGGSVIGAQSLTGAAPVPVRDAGEAAQAAAADPDAKTRWREASDAFLSASGYVRAECTNCGAVMKIPPEASATVTKCLRCKAPLRP